MAVYEIRFTGLEPQFDQCGTGFYRAEWEGKPLRAGITNEAWAHLLPRHGNDDRSLGDIEHPAHRTAREFTQRKLQADGRDASGAVVVTLADIPGDRSS